MSEVDGMSSNADKRLRRLYNNPAVSHAVNVLADHMITGAQYYALVELLSQDATAEEDSLPEGMCPDCYCIGFHANGCDLTVGGSLLCGWQSNECRHEGPMHTDVVIVDRAAVASTSCVDCGQILGTGSDG